MAARLSLLAQRFAALRRPLVRVQTRTASSAAPATPSNTATADGFDIAPPKKRLVNEAQFWGGLCWFWIFYQTYQNWDVVLVRTYFV